MNVISNEFFLGVLPNADLVLHIDYPKQLLNIPIFSCRVKFNEVEQLASRMSRAKPRPLIR
jgi:hypothetical protein